MTKRRIEPYWFAIIAVLAVAAGLFVYHLATRVTPPRAAFTVFGFSVYWYGIWIVSGIALGAWVASSIAAERARRLFEATVPAETRARPLAEVTLPDDIRESLTTGKEQTLGEVLWNYGLDPRRLGLNKERTTAAGAALAAAPDVAAGWLTDAPWRQWNPDHVWNGLIYVLILGVIGARLYHILTPSPSMAAVGIFTPLDYFRNPYQLLNFRGGGLGIYGAVAGGLLGLFIYTRRARISTLAWADLAVVGLALGQTIGRWGNFFNQELYGRPTDLPWAIYIDPPYRLPDYVDFSYFHPAFLYESLWSLGTFLVLYRLARRRSERLLPGEIMAFYFIAYAIGRSLLEMVRLDSRVVAFFGLETGLAIATVVSIILAVAAAIWVLWRRRRRARSAAAVG